MNACQSIVVYNVVSDIKQGGCIASGADPCILIVPDGVLFYLQRASVFQIDSCFFIVGYNIIHNNGRAAATVNSCRFIGLDDVINYGRRG